MTIPQPDHLKCEYMVDPIGIDTGKPRFGWNLSHTEKGRSPIAYQILVSPEMEELERGSGSHWDSGRVESDNTVNIEYEGVPLNSHSRYYWCVRWWDDKDGKSPYSAVSSFTTGFLKDKNWTGKWMTMKNPRTFQSEIQMVMAENSSPQYHGIYLRKDFLVKKDIKFAVCCVSGLGYYELFVNGNKAGDYLLDPGQTDYHQYALYSSFDVTDLLVSGENTLAMILGNGRHIKAYGYGKPMGVVQLVITCLDGSQEIAVSDETWKCAHGPVMENGLYFGECYDARNEMPGWDMPSFDDAEWEPVEIAKGPQLKSQTMPPIRATDILKAKQIFTPLSDTYVYDFGQNFTGWVKLYVKGPAGTKIRIRYAELLKDDLSLHRKTLRQAEATDVYVLKGEGLEIYEPRFTYHGFRYAEITGYPGVPTLGSLEGVFVHTDVESVGSFHCSDQLINAIHRNIFWGQLSNLMSIPTDCPQRAERMGWMGDAQLAAEESFYNFDIISFYAKYLEDIRLAQKEDGSLSDVVPPYWAIYPADPAWGSAYITIAWYCYLFTGDIRLLETHFDNMKRYLDFLKSATDGLIVTGCGKFGDWCPPGSILPTKTPIELTSTWYFYHDTVLLSRMAEIIKRNEDYRLLSDLAEQIKEAFNKRFMRDGRYLTVENGILSSLYFSQTSQLLPLYLDMVPEEHRQAALNHLKTAVINQSDCHLDTGIVGTRYLFDVLTENNLTEIAYIVATQRTYPGYGYMIEEGATTLWERWEKLEGSGMNSHNHIMLGSIDAWFYRTLAGLTPMEAGWRKARIKPPIINALSYVSASVNTVRGEVRISWKKLPDRLVLTVSLPVALTAEIFVPLRMRNDTIMESGCAIWKDGEEKEQVEGITILDETDGYVRLNAASGFYEFEVLS